jgi:acetoacetyl-CoA synthetase
LNSNPPTSVKPLWTHRYRQHIHKKFKQFLRKSQELHTWTIKSKHKFWIELWDYSGKIPKLPSSITKGYDDSKTIKDNPQFFEGVQINYAENVLSDRDPNAIALIGLREAQSLEGE